MEVCYIIRDFVLIFISLSLMTHQLLAGTAPRSKILLKAIKYLSTLEYVCFVHSVAYIIPVMYDRY